MKAPSDLEECRFKRMGAAPMATTAGQECASAMMLLPLMLLVDHPWAMVLSEVPRSRHSAGMTLIGVG